MPLPLEWSSGFHAVEPVVIFGSDGFRPKAWVDLNGAVVGYIASTGLDAEIARLVLDIRVCASFRSTFHRPTR